MLLSDRGIAEALHDGRVQIDPAPEVTQIQPASIDLRLSGCIRHFRTRGVPKAGAIDPLVGSTYEDLTTLERIGTYALRPGEFILGSTVEKLTLDNCHAARLEGKSSLGRLGLTIHSTAGFIDPGFSGHPTLEISNLLRRSLLLTAGMPICQLAIHMLDRHTMRPYGERGSYQDQGIEPEPSRYWKKYGVWLPDK